MDRSVANDPGQALAGTGEYDLHLSYQRTSARTWTPMGPPVA